MDLASINLFVQLLFPPAPEKRPEGLGDSRIMAIVVSETFSRHTVADALWVGFKPVQFVTRQAFGAVAHTLFRRVFRFDRLSLWRGFPGFSSACVCRMHMCLYTPMT